MKAMEAIDRLDPGRWKGTSPAARLDLLKRIRRNIDVYFDELVDADCKAKGIDRGDPANAHQVGTSVQATVVPIAANVSAAIALYEGLVRGRPLQPLEISPAGADRFDIRVGPRGRDRLLNGDRTDILRVTGQPRRVDPYQKRGGIIGVLGAGNFASSLEMINALFVESCAVVHKSHHINVAADLVWEKILQPLVEVDALSFCDADQGRLLTRDDRLTKIYFTGGAASAKAIMATTETELVSECGGNNPCVIVPGDRRWTAAEIRHQALQIATMVKINGGSVCGRVQTLVTRRQWPQRREFLDAVTLALRDQTPATSTYYPGVDKTFAAFQDAYPDARVITSRDKAPASDVLVIEDVDYDGFAVHHEAFCQIMSEVALDVPAGAEAFLAAAAAFCNENLLGTLAATVLIDEDTRKTHRQALDRAITELRYGAIGINTMPPAVWTNPYLTWGGNEEGEELVSGHGNFGNMLGFENVDKSIVFSGFTSPGHLINDRKQGWLDLSTRFTRYTIDPTWARLFALTGTVLRQRFQRPDF